MGRYAASTDVSTTRSRDEIERTLKRFGATAFVHGWDNKISPPRASTMFEIPTPGGLRRIRFHLPMPDPNDHEFTRTPTGKPRAAKAADDAYEQATRQRWRSLANLIKATLAAVEDGIITAEDAFLPYTVVTPDGRTVAEIVGPQITAGQLPALLPGPSTR